MTHLSHNTYNYVLVSCRVSEQQEIVSRRSSGIELCAHRISTRPGLMDVDNRIRRVVPRASDAGIERQVVRVVTQKVVASVSLRGSNKKKHTTLLN